MGRGGIPLEFPEPLEEGLVLSRPNRFIMIVRAEDGDLRCHCPTTGRLGDARIVNVPCLFKRAAKDGRKTAGTVEAISFDPVGKPQKSWIGIDQTMANRYFEFFLKTGQLGRMASGEVRREVRLGRSRIDFLVGSTYVEVKTPLVTLPMGDAPRLAHGRFDSFERLIRHMRVLSRAIRGGGRAVVALCYLYDAKPFRPPPADRYNESVRRASASAARRGVERWQVNLGLNENGVMLLRYFRNETVQTSTSRHRPKRTVHVTP